MEFYEQEVLNLLKAGKGKIAIEDYFVSVKDHDGTLSVHLFDSRGETLEQYMRVGEFEVRTPVTVYYPGQVAKAPDLHYYYRGSEFKPSYDFLRETTPYFEHLGKTDLTESIENCVAQRLQEFQEDGYNCWSKNRALLIVKGETAPVEGAEKLSFRKARKLWVTRETGGVCAIDDVYRM